MRTGKQIRVEVAVSVAGRPSRSSTRLATILDHLPDALLLVDPTGVVANANARALELLRAAGSPRPLIGRVIVDVLPGFGPARVAADPSGAPRTTERLLAKALDGTSFAVDVYRALVPWDSSGDHLLLVLHEVAEAGAEAELARTSGQAQAVLRATEEAVCGVDADATIVLANPAAARLLGVRVGEIAGKDLNAVALHTRLDGTPYPAGETPVGQALATGRRSARRREVCWRVDGTPLLVEMTVVPIIDGGAVVGAVAAMTDLTRRNEEDRRRLRLVDALEHKVGPALRAAMDSGGIAPATLTQLDAVAELVADAVDYERLMSGSAAPGRERVPIADLVRDAVAAASKGPDGAAPQLAVEAATVLVDRRRLTLALAELVRAAAAVEPAGPVSVAAALSGDRVRIAVRPPRGAAAATEGGPNPLLSWLQPRTGRQTGPDPDLAYIQIVAERHGGRFLLEPGSGSRSYVLELPLAAELPAPVVEPPADPGPRAEGRGGGEVAPVSDGADGPEEPAAPAPLAAVVGLRPDAPVIPMPTRPDAAVEAPGGGRDLQDADDRSRSPAPATEVSPAGVTAATTAPAATPTPATVVDLERAAALVWPAAAPGVAGALADRGSPAAPVSAVADLGREHTAEVVLVDPLAGPVSRRALAEVRGAAAAAMLPLIVIAGFTEHGAADTGSCVEPPVLLTAMRGPQATGAARVLVLEPDPALATALGASLLRGGLQAVYARDADEAMMRSALGPPELVLMGLDAEPGDRPGIVDWLVNAKRLIQTPILAYSLDGLADGYAERFERGSSLIGVGARADNAGVDVALADLVSRVGQLAARA